MPNRINETQEPVAERPPLKSIDPKIIDGIIADFQKRKEEHPELQVIVKCSKQQDELIASNREEAEKLIDELRRMLDAILPLVDSLAAKASSNPLNLMFELVGDPNVATLISCVMTYAGMESRARRFGWSGTYKVDGKKEGEVEG